MDKYTLDYYRELYYHEKEQNQMLHSRVAIPLTALSIIVTIIIYFFSVFKEVEVKDHTWTYALIFIMLLFLIGILAVSSIVIILRILWGKKHAAGCDPAKIEQYMRNVKSSYDNVLDKHGAIERELFSFLNDHYIGGAKVNWENNIRKAKLLRKTNIATAVALLLCFCEFLPLYMLVIRK